MTGRSAGLLFLGIVLVAAGCGESPGSMKIVSISVDQTQGGFVQFGFRAQDYRFLIVSFVPKSYLATGSSRDRRLIGRPKHTVHLGIGTADYEIDASSEPMVIVIARDHSVTWGACPLTRDDVAGLRVSADTASAEEDATAKDILVRFRELYESKQDLDWPENVRQALRQAYGEQDDGS